MTAAADLAAALLRGHAAPPAEAAGFDEFKKTLGRRSGGTPAAKDAFAAAAALLASARAGRRPLRRRLRRGPGGARNAGLAPEHRPAHRRPPRRPRPRRERARRPRARAGPRSRGVPERPEGRPRRARGIHGRCALSGRARPGPRGPEAVVPRLPGHALEPERRAGRRRPAGRRLRRVRRDLDQHGGTRENLSRRLPSARRGQARPGDPHRPRRTHGPDGPRRAGPGRRSWPRSSAASRSFPATIRRNPIGRSSSAKIRPGSPASPRSPRPRPGPAAPRPDRPRRPRPATRSSAATIRSRRTAVTPGSGGTDNAPRRPPGAPGPQHPPARGRGPGDRPQVPAGPVRHRHAGRPRRADPPDHRRLGPRTAARSPSCSCPSGRRRASWPCSGAATRSRSSSGRSAGRRTSGTSGRSFCVGGCFGIAAIHPLARAFKEAGNRVVVIVDVKADYLSIGGTSSRRSPTNSSSPRGTASTGTPATSPSRSGRSSSGRRSTASSPSAAPT